MVTPVLDKISSQLCDQVDYINSRFWEKMVELQGLSSYWSDHTIACQRVTSISRTLGVPTNFRMFIVFQD
jgi:hypothetical protein